MMNKKQTILVTVIAHIDAGKTTLVRNLLDNEESRLDGMTVEKKHRVTVKLKVFDWFCFDFYKIYLIDTPGHVDFAFEVKRSLRTTDLCFVLIDVIKGVCSQTIEYVKYAKDLNLEMILVFNKADLLKESKDSFLQRFKQQNNIFWNSNKWRAILWNSFKTKGNTIKNWIKHNYINVAESNSPGLFYVLDILEVGKKKSILLIRKNKPFKLKKGLELRWEDRRWKIDKIEDAHPDHDRGLCKITLTGETINDIISLNGNFIKSLRVKKDDIFCFHRENLIWINVFLQNRSKEQLIKFKEVVYSLLATDPYVGHTKKIDKFLGFGFVFSFSGNFHLDIFLERLKLRCSGLLITLSGVKYFIDQQRTRELKVHDDDFDRKKHYIVPGVKFNIRVRAKYLGRVCELLSLNQINFTILEKVLNQDRFININTPLEMVSSNNFVNELRRSTSGFVLFEPQTRYFFFSYLSKITVIINQTPLSQFDILCIKQRVTALVDKIFFSLKKNITKQLFEQRIYIKVDNKIIKGFRVKASRKDVTQKLYGGDQTRKMKLLEKQKLGKKRLRGLSIGKITLSHKVINQCIIDINK